MKFFCEYCGCRIDSRKDDKCPNCGASYKKNKEFLNKINEKKAKKTLKANELKSERKTKKKLAFIILIVGLLIGIGLIYYSVSLGTTSKIDYETTKEFKAHGFSERYYELRSKEDKKFTTLGFGIITIIGSCVSFYALLASRPRNNVINTVEDYISDKLDKEDED